MNAERLLAHYEEIADAPDAIARLHRFILDLSVCGKLVPQNPNDEPASVLLKRITKEKAGLVNAGKIRKRDDLPEIDEADVPFHVPSIWRWCRLGDLGSTQTGTTPPKAKPENYGKHIPFIKPGDIYPGHVDYSNEGLSRIGLDESGRLACPGSILMVCIGTIGKCQQIDRDCSFNQQINSLSPYGETQSRYLLIACQSEFFQKSAWAASSRTTIAILNKGNWELLPLPIPPLAEQRRIVAKVDELMALCDWLETARGSREAVRDRLTAASLARLNAPDPDTFQADARFALDALPALTTRPDQIKQLRQTILNLAVRGNLVPQDPNDELASELLKRIGAQTNHYDLDADHELPTSWTWALIEECFAVTGGMQKTPARTPRVNAFPYLGVGNVYRGRLDLANVKKFELAAGELERFRLEPEDILVVEGNGSAREIGRCAVWHGEIENCVHQNHLIRCRPKELQLTPYAALYLNSPDGMAEMKRLAITSAGLFSLSVGKIRKIPFPLPPLAEQHRIVAKVDALMALCDRLEASLTATAATRRRLLDALLAEALAPAEDRELEAAE